MPEPLISHLYRLECRDAERSDREPLERGVAVVEWSRTARAVAHRALELHFVRLPVDHRRIAHTRAQGAGCPPTSGATGRRSRDAVTVLVVESATSTRGAGARSRSASWLTK